MYTAKQIAEQIGASFQGEDINSPIPTSLAKAREHSIVFLSRYDEKTIKRINAIQNIVCITTNVLAKELHCTILVHEDPRYAYCLFLNIFKEIESLTENISKSSIIHKSALIGKQVRIGAGSVIGNDVCVGDGTKIGCNVVIAPRCIIGRDCVIKSNTTIGESGFGFARDKDNIPLHFPHRGNVVLDDRVEIGANCTVVQAVFDTTKISKDVKTDDHVHIAHNVFVGERCLLAAGVVLSGSTTLGNDVWIGPNAVISDHKSIGDRAWIALGSVVLNDVPDDTKMLGNPAKKINP